MDSSDEESDNEEEQEAVFVPEPTLTEEKLENIENELLESIEYIGGNPVKNIQDQVLEVIGLTCKFIWWHEYTSYKDTYDLT